MNPDDRIDHALRAIAQADASRDFASRVRERVEASDAERTVWWPRLATVCAAVLIVAAVTWWLRETPVSPTVHVAQTSVPAVPIGSVSQAPRLELRAELRDVAVNRHVSTVAVSVARVRTAKAAIGDHDRALEPLSRLEALSVPSIAPDAMVVVDHVIAPLAPIAPLSVREMLGDAERGEL